MYEYARNNENVDLPKKEVTIKKIELLGSDKESFEFKCLVSKGTYIRSLIRDLGNKVNIDFTMSSLVRTKQGDFKIKDAYTLNDINNNNFSILSIEDVLSNYPRIVMDKTLEKKVVNGCRLDNHYNIKDMVLFKNQNNNLVAIYKKEGTYLKIFKMIDNS